MRKAAFYLFYALCLVSLWLPAQVTLNSNVLHHNGIPIKPVGVMLLHNWHACFPNGNSSEITNLQQWIKQIKKDGFTCVYVMMHVNNFIQEVLFDRDTDTISFYPTGEKLRNSAFYLRYQKLFQLLKDNGLLYFIWLGKQTGPFYQKDLIFQGDLFPNRRYKIAHNWATVQYNDPSDPDYLDYTYINHNPPSHPAYAQLPIIYEKKWVDLNSNGLIDQGEINNEFYNKIGVTNGSIYDAEFAQTSGSFVDMTFRLKNPFVENPEDPCLCNVGEVWNPEAGVDVARKVPYETFKEFVKRARLFFHENNFDVNLIGFVFDFQVYDWMRWTNGGWEWPPCPNPMPFKVLNAPVGLINDLKSTVNSIPGCPTILFGYTGYRLWDLDPDPIHGRGNIGGDYILASSSCEADFILEMYYPGGFLQRYPSDNPLDNCKSWSYYWGFRDDTTDATTVVDGLSELPFVLGTAPPDTRYGLTNGYKPLFFQETGMATWKYYSDPQNLSQRHNIQTFNCVSNKPEYSIYGEMNQQRYIRNFIEQFNLGTFDAWIDASTHGLHVIGANIWTWQDDTDYPDGYGIRGNPIAPNGTIDGAFTGIPEPKAVFRSLDFVLKKAGKHQEVDNFEGVGSTCSGIQCNGVYREQGVSWAADTGSWCSGSFSTPDYTPQLPPGSGFCNIWSDCTIPNVPVETHKDCVYENTHALHSVFSLDADDPLGYATGALTSEYIPGCNNRATDKVPLLVNDPDNTEVVLFVKAYRKNLGDSDITHCYLAPFLRSDDENAAAPSEIPPYSIWQVIPVYDSIDHPWIKISIPLKYLHNAHNTNPITCINRIGVVCQSRDPFRRGHFDFLMDSLYLVENDPTPSVFVGAQSIDVDEKLSERALNIRTVKANDEECLDCSWSLSTDSDWILLAVNHGFGSQEGIPYQIRANTGAAPREGHIYLNKNKIFTIRQKGSAPFNFNSDWSSDILWRHAGSGTLISWLMNGNGVQGALYLGSANTSWTVVASGDYDGNRLSDILWRNTATDDLCIWFCGPGGVIGSLPLGTVPASWHVLGANDFNADGISDILWRNVNDGFLSVWLMSPTGVLGSTYAGGISDPNWFVIGTGDFNLDDRADVLWRHATSGALSVWLENESGFLTDFSPGVVGVDWKIVGLGDVDGNQITDILWQHVNGGEIIAWHMGFGCVLHSVSIGILSDADWKTVGIQDVNADGRDDLFWRHATTGETSVWFLNDNPGIQGQLSPGVVDPVWTTQNHVNFPGFGY